MSTVVIRNETADGKVVTVVTQKMLETHLRLERQLKASATTLFNSLQLGATVEAGAVEGFIERGEEKRPNWRAALLEKCGEEVVTAVREATAPTPFERLRVRPVKGAKK